MTKKILNRKHHKISALLIVTTLLFTQMGMAQITINEDDASGDDSEDDTDDSDSDNLVYEINGKDYLKKI